MSSGKMEAEPAATTFTLLNDQPVGSSGGHDILGTTEVATYLARLIEASRYSTPFTLGIDAGWGMGKSSLMLGVQDQLRANKSSGIESVWFNAWTAEGANALDGLIKSVLISLDENVLRRGLRAIMSRRQLIASVRILLIIAASYFHLTRVADEIWNRLSVDARSRNKIRIQMAGMFQRWSTSTKRSPHGRTMVVFIDDLDRCSNEVILEICEAMKLYLDVPGIAFVVGCDQAVLGQAALSAERQSQNVANASYLEKIIQVTYTKPMPFDDQIEELIDHLAESSGTRRYFTDSVKRIVIDRTGRNPRRIKRLINSFVLEYSLDPGWAEYGAEALIIIILMRQFYPDFYHVIANPAADDIAAEFLSYFDIRTNFQLGREPSDAERRYFETHLVKAPGAQYTPEDLARLEQELPVAFPQLSRDMDFVSLVRTLSVRDDFEPLRHRLQRHPISALIPEETGAQFSASDAESRDLVGLHILWISYAPVFAPIFVRAEQPAADAIIGAGGIVPVVRTSDDALAALGTGNPDVVIVSIIGPDDVNDGLNDLRKMRADNIYTGPVIFYTPTRMATRSLQLETESLGARVAASPDTLLEYLRTLPARPETDASLSSKGDPQPVPERHLDPEPTSRRTRDKANRWLSGES